MFSQYGNFVATICCQAVHFHYVLTNDHTASEVGHRASGSDLSSLLQHLCGPLSRPYMCSTSRWFCFGSPLHGQFDHFVDGARLLSSNFLFLSASLCALKHSLYAAKYSWQSLVCASPELKPPCPWALRASMHLMDARRSSSHGPAECFFGIPTAAAPRRCRGAEAGAPIVSVAVAGAWNPPARLQAQQRESSRCIIMPLDGGAPARRPARRRAAASGSSIAGSRYIINPSPPRAAAAAAARAAVRCVAKFN
eukprot:SAG31_NODE_1398_length_8501_cov_5.407046_5_plen_252_part_00